MAEENVNGLSREELTKLLAEIQDKKTGSTDIIPSQNDPPEDGSAEDILPDDAPPDNSLPEECSADESPPEDTAAEESSAVTAPERHKRGKSLLRMIGRICASLLIAAAAVVLIVNFVFPVMRIYGSSMSSNLIDGDIVIARKTTNLKQGDICAFNYGSRILCKRVIGLEGDVIEINGEGTVFVNGNELDEPYLKGKSLGTCDIEFPFTVPEGSYFVLGDNRRSSIDSRNTVLGCVSEEQIVGKLIFCILPIPSFGKIE